MRCFLLALLSFVDAQTENRSWEEALDLATKQVNMLTLKEKVTLASGVGWGQIVGILKI